MLMLDACPCLLPSLIFILHSAVCSAFADACFLYYMGTDQDDAADLDEFDDGF